MLTKSDACRAIAAQNYPLTKTGSSRVTMNTARGMFHQRYVFAERHKHHFVVSAENSPAPFTSIPLFVVTGFVMVINAQNRAE